ncbi:MAG: hypothetical protein ACO2ZM_08985 [Francisellaceae bacterium]
MINNCTKQKQLALKLLPLAAKDQKWLINRLPDIDKRQTFSMLKQLKKYRLNNKEIESLLHDTQKAEKPLNTIYDSLQQMPAPLREFLLHNVDFIDTQQLIKQLKKNDATTQETTMFCLSASLTKKAGDTLFDLWYKELGFGKNPQHLPVDNRSSDINTFERFLHD